MQKYFLIAIGGGVGSIARYWVTTTAAARIGVGFPYGTMIVNLIACLAIGFLITSATKRVGKNSAWRFLVAVGFIGAFSTFSTFEWDAYHTMQTGAFLLAAIYVAASMIFGILAVWGGSLLAEAVS